MLFRSNDTATTEIYTRKDTLSLHDALPIYTAHRSDSLALPHPEVTSRRFVLVPLLELDPELRLPDGAALCDALAALPPGHDVRLAGPPLL